MTWTLLGLDHGRWGYVERSLAALDKVVGLDFFDRRIFSHDGPIAAEGAPLLHRFDEVTYSRQRTGLAANLQRGWDMLGPDEWVFHLELDFEVVDAPLTAMRAVLELRPRLAQMVLERQPVNASEVGNGGLLGGDNIPTFTAHGGPRGPFWREQDHLFSFNPCVYHSSVATKAGTETSVTQRLRADGRTFGFWGAQGDAPRCRHIGVQGGMGSPGWRV